MSSKSSSSEQPMVLFKHLRNMQQIRPPPITCVPERFTLDQIAAYNIHIDTGDTKTSSIVTLRDVPSFLIEAFSKFEQLEGCKVEGVFRKEGNSLRCKDDATPVFFGAQSISSSFHVHDVCSWIKKFFRELRQPIFGNRESKVLKFAEDFGGDVLVAALLSILERLPASHMGAMGYLMRCLQEISESSHLHQMTIENLATVFAPAIFRGINHQDSREPKVMLSKLNRSGGSQDDLLRSLKRTNDLQVKVIKVLIENAEKIGAAKDCYKASRSESDATNKERKLIASSAQRNAEVTSSKPPHCYGGTQMKINSAMMKKNSRSSSNLATEPSASSLLPQRNISHDDVLNSPRKDKQKRSNSVVRILQSFKKSVTNLTSDTFLSTPDLPGLTNKKIQKPTKSASHHRQQTPITQSVSVDPSTCTSQQPEHACASFQDISKVMSPKNSNSTSNDQGFSPEMGVVNRRIQQFKELSNNSGNVAAARGISGIENLSLNKPAEKPASHGLLWKRTKVNERTPEQSTKSHKYASSRAKSVNSLHSKHQGLLGSVRPSVSATTQLPSSALPSK